MKKDLMVFSSILVVVLGGILALYWYNMQTGWVDEFSRQLFSWLVY